MMNQTNAEEECRGPITISCPSLNITEQKHAAYLPQQLPLGREFNLNVRRKKRKGEKDEMSRCTEKIGEPNDVLDCRTTMLLETAVPCLFLAVHW